MRHAPDRGPLRIGQTCTPAPQWAWACLAYYRGIGGLEDIGWGDVRCTRAALHTGSAAHGRTVQGSGAQWWTCRRCCCRTRPYGAPLWMRRGAWIRGDTLDATGRDGPDRTGPVVGRRVGVAVVRLVRHTHARARCTERVVGTSRLGRLLLQGPHLGWHCGPSPVSSAPDPKC